MQGLHELCQPFVKRLSLFSKPLLYLSAKLIDCSPAVHVLPDKAAEIIQLYVAVFGAFEKNLSYFIEQPLVADTDLCVILLIRNVFVQGITLWYIVEIIVFSCQ